MTYPTIYTRCDDLNWLLNHWFIGTSYRYYLLIADPDL